MAITIVIALAAAFDHALIVSLIFTFVSLIFILRGVRECMAAMGAFQQAIQRIKYDKISLPQNITDSVIQQSLSQVIHRRKYVLRNYRRVSVHRRRNQHEQSIMRRNTIRLWNALKITTNIDQESDK